MRDQDKIKAKLAKLFDLPQDVLLNLPVISIIGNLNIKVENHRGIIKYTPELVKIKASKGELLITGKELIIEKLSKEKVMVTGKITDLSFDLL
ncbi:sporulation protein YqfC [Halobacteroides halobius DSM 5150]|uniref:Sporulation protein YqfC n=1 Tax=Halobacteroides halobius (strain ATCC 35273 / DSM 5150 / MD-1) TaxID=748449 RepID=L0K9Y1_HALHC|nr:sporulation protein YqfC [Halobacteroides halobius]AGB41801.1 sporulation protein YqfC [Halobacteroides halobius DSM 5150]